MKIRCRKCHGKDIRISYHKNSYSCSYREMYDKGNEGEHLHYYCRTCRYTWAGKCADAVEET
ncbi:MAG: hypothetical protein SV062_07440 [Thermodesulfobacteriota bacterium]|nr:hypothetical protein [Thermodesulfobacteriota bacterium]